MATVLRDALKTIQNHRALNPHYAELLDILERILILREEYGAGWTKRYSPSMKNGRGQMAGGFPLIDFSTVMGGLEEPQAYFLALLGIGKSGLRGKPARCPERSSRASFASAT